MMPTRTVGNEVGDLGPFRSGRRQEKLMIGAAKPVSASDSVDVVSGACRTQSKESPPVVARLETTSWCRRWLQGTGTMTLLLDGWSGRSCRAKGARSRRRLKDRMTVQIIWDVIIMPRMLLGSCVMSKAGRPSWWSQTTVGEGTLKTVFGMPVQKCGHSFQGTSRDSSDDRCRRSEHRRVVQGQCNR